MRPQAAERSGSLVYYTLAVLLILGGGLCWLSNLFSLPGNWAAAGRWSRCSPVSSPVQYPRGACRGRPSAFARGAGVAGEIIEFAAGAAGAAKLGADRRSMWLRSSGRSPAASRGGDRRAADPR